MTESYILTFYKTLSFYERTFIIVTNTIITEAINELKASSVPAPDSILAVFLKNCKSTTRYTMEEVTWHKESSKESESSQYNTYKQGRK